MPIRPYILIQFFIIHTDDLGNRLKAALIERARAGVRVYFLFDRIGSVGLSRAYKEDLKSAGIHVGVFRVGRGWLNRFRINFRNHRKIVVVDGEKSWVGGHNVGDEYLGKSRRFSSWRDTHVKMAGPGHPGGPALIRRRLALGLRRAARCLLGAAAHLRQRAGAVHSHRPR